LSGAAGQQQQARTWAYPGKSPTNSEYGRSGDQWEVDLESVRQLHRLTQQGALTRADVPKRRRGNQNRAPHGERQRGIPAPRHVEKSEYSLRIAHARQQQSGPKKDTRD